MERDINVVANVKKDGSVAFKTGDGLPLEMGGGKAMRNVVMGFRFDGVKKIQMRVETDTDPAGQAIYSIVEPNVIGGEGSGFYAISTPVGMPPEEIHVYCDDDMSWPEHGFDMTVYKAIGPELTQIDRTKYEITNVDPEFRTFAILLTPGIDISFWAASDIVFEISEHQDL